MSVAKINLEQKLSLFDTHWDPKVVASYNDNDVMVVKFIGEYPFHTHADTDDFFLVLEGEVIMDFDAQDSVTFGAGELVIVPKGVIHRPRAMATVARTGADRPDVSRGTLNPAGDRFLPIPCLCGTSGFLRT